MDVPAAILIVETAHALDDEDGSRLALDLHNEDSLPDRVRLWCRPGNYQSNYRLHRDGGLTMALSFRAPPGSVCTRVERDPDVRMVRWTSAGPLVNQDNQVWARLSMLISPTTQQLALTRYANAETFSRQVAHPTNEFLFSVAAAIDARNAMRNLVIEEANQCSRIENMSPLWDAAG